MDIVIFTCIFILVIIIGKFIFRLDYILLCIITVFIQVLLIAFEGNSRKPPKTKLHLSYEQYIRDTASYDYWIKKKNTSYWFSLNGKEFEYSLAELFSIRGYKAILTKDSGDKGVDIILEKGSEIIIVQCKAHKKKISRGVAEKLTESMEYFNVNKAILASLSGFTSGVNEYVRGTSIELMDVGIILGMIID